MQPRKLSKTAAVFLHIAAWASLGFITLFYPPLSWDFKVPAVFYVKQGLNLTIVICLFYFNALYLAPRLVLKGKIAGFAAFIICSVILTLVLARFIELRLHVFEQLVRASSAKAIKNPFSLDIHLFMVTLLVLVSSTAMAAIRRWQEDAEQHQLIEKQHITSELALLKAQINPHFFFNTLNNIYALTYSDVPVSREAILKLSRMMRYVLYETIHDKAVLSKEIAFVKDYIELMKLRLHHCTTVRFEESEPDHEYAVAPMLLLPFIENAFKHGSSTMQNAEIQIDLQVSDGLLLLKVLNHIYFDKDALTMESGGIGLVNTQRRLNLLYPQKHDLMILEDKERKIYEIVLKIDLDKNLN